MMLWYDSSEEMMIPEIGDILKSDNSGTVSKEEVPLIDSGCYEVPRVTYDGVITGQGQWVEWEACECSARYTPRGGSDVRCAALTMPVNGVSRCRGAPSLCFVVATAASPRPVRCHCFDSRSVRAIALTSSSVSTIAQAAGAITQCLCFQASLVRIWSQI